MAGSKVIDADGHIIERTEELRKYLKSPFNKRVGPLKAVTILEPKYPIFGKRAVDHLEPGLR